MSSRCLEIAPRCARLVGHALLAGIAFAVVPLTGGLVTLWRDRVGAGAGDDAPEPDAPEPEAPEPDALLLPAA